MSYVSYPRSRYSLRSSVIKKHGIAEEGYFVQVKTRSLSLHIR
jgi:hypothetical protein